MTDVALDEGEFLLALSISNEQVVLSNEAGRLREVLIRLGTPLTLREFLVRHAYKRSVFIGGVYFSDAGSMIEENTGEFGCVPAGLLVIGSAANGDPFAVDIDALPGAVGFIDHEKLWSGKPNVRSFFAVCGRSIGAYFHRLVLDPSCPSDYSEAETAGEF